MDDTELLDLLSLDDAALQNTYLFHLPPDPTHIRLPALLWARIRQDLNEYTVTRDVDGVNAVTWYYRQFSEVARARYTPESCARQLHSMMADYFLGTWSDRVKPLKLYKKKIGTYPDAMRGVPPQPLAFSSSKSNLRKLNELPYHLALSGRYDELLDETMTNFNWLYQKSKAFSIHDILDDFKFGLQHITKDCETYKKVGANVFQSFLNLLVGMDV